MSSLFPRLRQFLDRTDSDHVRIARGFVLVFVFAVIGKFFGIGKEIAIAYRFGVNEVVDVYILVLTFVSWLPSVWASILNSVYVPLVHELKDEEREKFTRQVTGITILCAGLITVLLMTLLPALLPLIYSSASAEKIAMGQALAAGMAPLAGLGILVAHFSVQLLAEERHANTLYNAIPPFVLMVFVLLWPVDNSAAPLMFGTVIGWGLQAVGLLYLLVQAKLWRRPQLSFSSQAWLKFRSGIGILSAGVLLMSFVEPISTVIASGLGVGNVASYGYTVRLLALFLTLGATAVGRAILPVLSNTQKTANQVRYLAMQWAGLMFIGGVAVCAVVWIMSPWFVQLLLQRGAFTAQDTASVSDAVRFGAFQIPLYFSGIVFAQYFASMQLYKFIFMSSIIGMTMKTVCAILFARHFEFAGIVLANVPMYFSTALFFLVAIKYSTTVRQRIQEKDHA